MDEQSGLKITLKQFGNSRVVAVEGHVDHDTASELRAALDDAITTAGADHTIVDLTKVATIDSAILAALMRAKMRATAQSVRLWLLVDPAGGVNRLLTAANLLGHLGVVYELDAVGPVPRPSQTPSGVVRTSR
jgi:anti-anti-sigma factor